MQQARLDDIKVVTNVTLANDHLSRRDLRFAHGIDHAGLLFLIKVTEEEIVFRGCFDSPKLIFGFGVDG
jgi:hypothetical protein